ncbi:MAG TPA: hypothetical protein ENK99_05485 [Campylobacterales bacterium]|nr:hypothetical protein [Campylobacterales bacterium]
MDEDRLQKLQREIDLLVKEKKLLEEIYALRKMLEEDKDIVYTTTIYTYPKIYRYITSDDDSFSWDDNNYTTN